MLEKRRNLHETVQDVQPNEKRRVCQRMNWKKTTAIYLSIFLVLFSVTGLAVNANESTGKTATVQAEYYKNNEQLKYPQVSDVTDKKMEKRINQDFTNYIKKAYKEYKENEKQAEKHGFAADFQTEFEVKYNQLPRLSILMSKYIFSGGAHGNTTVESFNYNVETGKRVYLTDILTTDEQIKAVTDYVWEYAIERPEIFYPDLKKEDIQLGKQTAFYFNNQGITLVFQQYEIAPYVSGNQEIVIPSEIYEET